jgi:hypothetical protein
MPRIRPQLLCSVLTGLLLAIVPSAATAATTGVSLSGPLTNLTLCAPYAYKVSVVSSQPHREAVVVVAAYGANDARQVKTVNLAAGRRWTGNFTEYFSRPADMSKGIQVVVMVLPPHRGYTTLYRRTYAITPAPGQGEAPRSPGSCGPVPPYFGS